MTSLRPAGVIPGQELISSRVLPHPKQYPVFSSIEQTRMQGVSMAVIVPSDENSGGRQKADFTDLLPGT